MLEGELQFNVRGRGRDVMLDGECTLLRACHQHILIFSGCPNQELGWPFLFKILILGACSYFGVDTGSVESAIDGPREGIISLSKILSATL
jgi:hypothetical protein